MSHTENVKLSVTLALQGMQDASEAVRGIEDDLALARAVRDEYIRDSFGNISITKIARITKLSRETIYRIVQSGD